ncbi:MAG: hypothetical protein COW42_11790 [Deltaproteobacteria bacterium CG17_big_fil_post_rev_8_21_14_2_50_63_7]|nr:MAG: hypothetical protein COW42_11790 [Deltaproteobacteria bacterium CG17_big_fil_post_rev_8_21_14_2_50_63_7]
MNRSCQSSVVPAVATALMLALGAQAPAIANSQGPCHNGTCQVVAQSCDIKYEGGEWVCLPKNTVTTSIVSCENKEGPCAYEMKTFQFLMYVCKRDTEGDWTCNLELQDVACHICK